MYMGRGGKRGMGPPSLLFSRELHWRSRLLLCLKIFDQIKSYFGPFFFPAPCFLFPPLAIPPSLTTGSCGAAVPSPPRPPSPDSSYIVLKLKVVQIEDASCNRCLHIWKLPRLRWQYIRTHSANLVSLLYNCLFRCKMEYRSVLNFFTTKTYTCLPPLEERTILQICWLWKKGINHNYRFIKT